MKFLATLLSLGAVFLAAQSQQIVLSNFAKASTETIREKVKSSWEKSATGFEMNVEIPFNCSALVHIPSSEPKDIYENGGCIDNNPNIKFVRFEHGYNIFQVSSGKHTFSY